MKQQTLAVAADQTFENYRKPARRDEFAATMEAIVLWAALCEVIEPYYPKAGIGRPPIGLERMLRIHFNQHWFNLADLSCEEAFYDSFSLRRFVRIDLGREPVLDATTMQRFQCLLNEHKLGEALFAKVGRYQGIAPFSVNGAQTFEAACCVVGQALDKRGVNLHIGSVGQVESVRAGFLVVNNVSMCIRYPQRMDKGKPFDVFTQQFADPSPWRKRSPLSLKNSTSSGTKTRSAWTAWICSKPMPKTAMRSSVPVKR